MKVLLANVPWHNVENGKGWLGVRAGSRWPHTWKYSGCMINPYVPFPFYLATATALLKKNNIEAKVIDCIAEGNTYDEFYSKALDYNPEYILIESSTPSLENDLRVSAKLKELFNENIKIIFTGLHYEIENVEFLCKYNQIDYTVYGEYEYPLLKLLQAIEKDRDFENLNNVTYRKEDGKVIKKERGELIDINLLPWPERDSLPNTYYDGIAGPERKQLQITTSRGCVYNCIFCAFPQIMYGKRNHRIREPQDVVNEILHNLKKYKYKNIFIDDDTFNVSKEHVLELCRLFKENGLNKYKWAVMGRADIIDKETLHALKDAGVYAIKYGVESFDEEVLKKTGKNMDVKKNVENIILTKELGIQVYLTFCLGLPGDTKDTIEHTLNEAMKLPFDFAQFSIATPYPGSRMYDEYDKNGWLLTKDWNLYNASEHSVIETDTLSKEDLEHYVKLGWQLANKKEALNRFDSAELKQDLENELAEINREDNLLILQSANYNLTCKIIEIIKGLGYGNIYLLTHEKFTKYFGEVLNGKNIFTFNNVDSFEMNAIKDLKDKISDNLNIKRLIVPYSNENREGYENVNRVAESFNVPIIGINSKGCVFNGRN